MVLYIPPTGLDHNLVRNALKIRFRKLINLETAMLYNWDVLSGH